MLFYLGFYYPRRPGSKGDIAMVGVRLSLCPVSVRVNISRTVCRIIIKLDRSIYLGNSKDLLKSGHASVICPFFTDFNLLSVMGPNSGFRPLS